MSKNYGYTPSEINEDEHYMLGDGWLKAEILMPEGHGWGDYLPVSEIQNRNGLETFNCTSYGTLHALATLGKKKFGAQFQNNLSERYSGVMTGTTPNGNDPHRVIELIRTFCGVVPEVFLPFDDTIQSWSEYYRPNPMSYYLFQVGRHWLKKYKIGHDWVFSPNDDTKTRQEKMKEALKFSPLGVSGYAWYERGDGRFYSLGKPNHWFTIYDYIDGNSWLAFDSYDNTHKRLDWNFEFGQAKRYSLDLINANLGEAVEPAKLPYAVYLIKSYFNEILR